jgi:polyadenylate-binding protein
MFLLRSFFSCERGLTFFFRFKVVKSFGVKGAPKITIALLDQEDLRALAHVMNSYPTVLKERVMALKMTK